MRCGRSGAWGWAQIARRVGQGLEADPGPSRLGLGESGRFSETSQDFEEAIAHAVGGLEELRLHQALVDEAQCILEVLTRPLAPEARLVLRREEESVGTLFRRRRNFSAQIHDPSHGWFPRL